MDSPLPSASSGTSPHQSVLATAWAVCRKELVTSFRDRQVWIYTVVLPLLMYPVLFWVLLQASTVIQGRKQIKEVEVAMVAEAGEEARAIALGAELREVLGAPLGNESEAAPESAAPETRNGERPDEAAAADEVADAAPVEPVVLYGLERPWDPDRAVAAMAAKPEQVEGDEEAIDAYVLLRAATADAPRIEIVHDSARANSVLAMGRLEDQLERLGRRAREAGAEQLGVDLASLAAFDTARRSTAGSKDTGALLLSMMLPMMLIIMSVMGSFYPAVDLTAGEIERKTEETTLLLPVPRVGIQLGKLLAVAAAGGLAAVMNLTGIVLAAEHLLGMMGAGNRFEIELSIPHLLLTLPLLLAFLIFVSSVLVSVASFAKTFKQGQSLLGSAQTLFLLPAIASSLPGLVLGPGLAAIPVVGLSMALRTILRGDPFGELPWGSLAVAFLAQFAAAALALWLGLRLLDRELGAGDERTIPQRVRALLAGRDAAPR